MRLSLFRSTTSSQPIPLDMEWSEFVERLSEPNPTPCTSETCIKSHCTHKLGQGLFTPGAYKPNTTRGKANVERISALVYDLDHLTSERLNQITLTGLQYFIHSSHSDDPDIDDRCFRLIINLSREVTPSEWDVLWFGVAKWYGIPYDDAATDISRLFFVPSHPKDREYITHLQDGQPLDVERWLSLLVTSPTSPTLPTTSINRVGSQSDVASTLSAVDSSSPKDYEAFLSRVKEIQRRKRNTGLQEELVSFYEQALKGDPITTGTSRNEALKSLVMSLLCSFGSDYSETIKVFLRPSCIAMGDDKPGKSYLDVLDYMLRRDGPKADDIRAASKLTIQAPAQERLDQLQEAPRTGDLILDTFNAQYFLGWNADRTEFLHWKEDEKQITPVSQKSVQMETKPLKHQTAEGKIMDGYKYWSEHPKRRAYDRVVFAPMRQLKQTEYNLFKGYGVEPRAAEWPCIREYWLNILCSGDVELFRYTFTWVAQMIQQPYKLAGIALVLYGSTHGAGKGTFYQILSKMIGEKLSVSEGDISKVFEGFNGHLERALLVNVDESEGKPNRKLMDLMKHAITEPTKHIEHKGMTRFEAPNFTRYIITTNNKDAVHIDPSDRRFFCLTPSEDRVGDFDYFSNLYHELNQTDAASGLLYDLLTFDLSTGADLRKIPETTAREQMRESSLNTVVQFWEIYSQTLTSNMVSHDELFDAYRKQFPSSRITMPTFIKEIRTVCPSAKEVRASNKMGDTKLMLHFESQQKIKDDYEQTTKTQRKELKVISEGAREVWDE